MDDERVGRPGEPSGAGGAGDAGLALASPAVGVDDAARLTAAIAAGDPDALARFYEAWFDRMVAIARRASGRDESFCLDVVQESFMKMIRKMRRIESGEALAVWVRRVVTRTAYDMLRAERRRVGREERRVREISSGDTSAPPDAGRLRWLERELASLDHEEAEMMLARYRFGWTLRAIGARFGLSVGAVDGRLTRIVAGIRERAREAEGNPGLETGATREEADHE